MKIRTIIISYILTLLLLVLLEVITTALIPALGLQKYRLSFHLLIIIFMGLRLDNPLLPLMILIIQFFHSAFTIEGWAYGTFAGVLICLVISKLKGMLHFKSSFVTIVSVQILVLIWFVIESFLIFFRTNDLGFIWERFKIFLPESFLLSLVSPFFFSLLHYIWKSDKESIGVNE